jgi:DNA (cytosine-5)-methyltransferase 1
VKYISVCSGIEAATVAWHGLGWEPLAFGEIDAFPSAVLAHHYPEVPNLGDMSKFREWPEELLVECDLLVGGTPCQAFSVAGLRKSLEDDRGNLSLVYVQLFHHINEVRKRHGRQPAIALWENVPGVLSTRDNAFGCFVSGLLGVDDTIETQDGKWPKAGFLGSETVRVGYRVLDAQYFAVAQRRRRVFLVAVPCELVASLGERACPSEILSLRESVLGNPPTRGAAWEGAARPTAASAGGCCGREVAGTLDASYHKGCGERSGIERDVVVACPPYARTLTQRMHKGFDSTLDSQTPIVAFHPTQDPKSSTDGSTHAMGCGSKQGCCTQAVAFKPGQSEAAGGTFVTEEFAPTIQGQNNGSTAVPAVAFTKAKRAQSTTDDESWVPGEVAPTQNQFDVGDTRATTVVAFRENTRCEVGYVDPPQSLASGGGKPGQGYCGVQIGMAVRRLTPRECEFLQGFPPDYTLVTHRNKPAADGPRYRALGNSMAVPCMAWLGWRIHKATGGDQ